MTSGAPMKSLNRVSTRALRAESTSGLTSRPTTATATWGPTAAPRSPPMSPETTSEMV